MAGAVPPRPVNGHEVRDWVTTVLAVLVAAERALEHWVTRTPPRKLIRSRRRDSTRGR